MATILTGVVAVAVLWGCCESYEWDENGYITYCPCMGRFGNQASQFLGALQFAKDINRTIILPPWIVWKKNGKKLKDPVNVPFSEWFKVESIQRYHRATAMEDFLDVFGRRWSNRTGYCYKPPTQSDTICEMTKGSPFGPFWKQLGIEFNNSVAISTSYSTSSAEEWRERYPPSIHPVLAFKGTPGAFPALKKNRHLQQYVEWSDVINGIVNEYIIDKKPYIAVHMRRAKDWERACELGTGKVSFFESFQCLEGTKLSITKEICQPSIDTMAHDLQQVISETGIYNVYIGSDTHPPTDQLQKYLDHKVKLHHLDARDDIVDLGIFSRSDYFIGNCVSSFTAFIGRERQINNRPIQYWGVAQALQRVKSEL